MNKDINSVLGSMSFERDTLDKKLDRLYKCRDLEISNLWQRSIFLSAFLVLCFTGYGYLLVKIVDYLANYSVENYDENIEFYLNIAALVLGCISAIFSLLWIMMAKGSKAWYEVYETAITTFENDYYEEIGLPREYMGEMGIHHSKLSNCLFNSQAGAYSVSKINIKVGQSCLIIWIAVILFHSISFIFPLPFLFSSIYGRFALVLIILLITIILALYECVECRSGHLYDSSFKKNGKFRHSRNDIEKWLVEREIKAMKIRPEKLQHSKKGMKKCLIEWEINRAMNANMNQKRRHGMQVNISVFRLLKFIFLIRKNTR